MKKIFLILFCSLNLVNISIFASNVQAYKEGPFNFVSIPAFKTNNLKASLEESNSFVPYQCMRVGEDGNIYSVMAVPNEKDSKIDVTLRLFNSSIKPIAQPINLGSLSTTSFDSIKFDLYAKNSENVYCLFASKPFFKIIGIKDGKLFEKNIDGKIFKKYENSIANFGGFYVDGNVYSFYFYVTKYEEEKIPKPAIIYTYTTKDGSKWKTWKPGAVTVNSSFGTYNHPMSANNDGYNNIVYQDESGKIDSKMAKGVPTSKITTNLVSGGKDYFSNISEYNGKATAVNAALIPNEPIQVTNIVYPNDLSNKTYGTASSYANEIIVGAIINSINGLNNIITLYDSNKKTITFIGFPVISVIIPDVFNSNFRMMLLGNRLVIGYFKKTSNDDVNLVIASTLISD
jgi:hypothetical protein